MVTAGDIIKASRALPKAEQTKYIIEKSTAAVAAEKKASSSKTSSFGLGFTPPTGKETKTVSIPAAGLSSFEPTPQENISLIEQVQSGIAFSSGKTTLTPTRNDTSNASTRGKISNLKHRFSGNELYVSVTYQNTSTVTREVRAYLYTSSGELVDKEPDTKWIDVKAGQNYTFQLNSNWKYYSIADFGGAYKVAIIEEGGIFIEEWIVYLTTGEVSNPKEKNEGTPTNPKTSTPVGTGGSSETPAYTGNDGQTWLEKLFGTGDNSKMMTYVLVGIVAYMLLKKK